MGPETNQRRILEKQDMVQWIPFVLLALMFLPTIYDLVIDWWEDSNYSHGFLIPLVSGYWLYGQRDELSKINQQHDRRGLIVLAFSLLLFVMANGAAEYFTLRLSFVMALVGLIYAIFGLELLKKIWFPLFFLLFMIPIPYVIYYAISFPMQQLASVITVYGLDFLGMAVIRQGNIIHVGNHSLEVAEACSGIRSLVALLALGAIFARSSQKRFSAQFVLFLSTIPIAVVGNVIRVLLTTILVATGGDFILEEPFHSGMGLIVFIVAFVGLSLLSVILRRVFK